jgi:hypothetical protein
MTVFLILLTQLLRLQTKLLSLVEVTLAHTQRFQHLNIGRCLRVSLRSLRFLLPEFGGMKVADNFLPEDEQVLAGFFVLQMVKKF